MNRCSPHDQKGRTHVLIFAWNSATCVHLDVRHIREENEAQSLHFQPTDLLKQRLNNPEKENVRRVQRSLSLSRSLPSSPSSHYFSADGLAS